ncbi:SAM hydrolase/SAM-dependent halogenase family protein [Hamadaea tsunoensis]|uniref:SAM hydrolase/SAM-dependent halogenase family protein n=1 Tax=Hamadaea tsunoensis TaxID=53368 RepID=UPI00041A1A6F|nr:SAM-dependent chlorinase/fluorinase [Hamadaea tsunoensis]
MPGYEWISLTTDYGLSDGFVAACHGVLGRLAPAVRTIDVSHLVPPGDVTRGAAVLAQTVAHLPRAIHVGVVDPGVGTERRPVALVTPRGLLVGPDNGLLPWAADELGGVTSAYQLTNRAWFAASVSRTFHGRDVFVPVAARLANGGKLVDAGQEIDPVTLVRLPDPVVAIGDGWLEAEVLTIDRFGNVQLAAPSELLRGLPGQMVVGGCRAINGATFADAPQGGIVVFPDSADRIAVAVNGGRAAVVLGVTPGDVLRITA